MLLKIVNQARFFTNFDYKMINTEYYMFVLSTVCMT